MKKIFNLCLVVIALFGFMQQTNAQTASVPSAESGHYYILYSTHNATVDLTKGDGSVFRGRNHIGNVAGKVLYQDPNTPEDGKLKYGDKATIESNHGRNYLLWQIVKTCDGTYLKNKGSGKYVRESKRVSTDPYPIEIVAEEGSTTQYSFHTMKNATAWGGFCIVYEGSEVDSWRPQQGENSWSAWIWEEQPETFTVPTLACTTLSVASTDDTKGSAYIDVAGRPMSTNIGDAGADIFAYPNPGYQFVSWSDGTNTYTDNPHNYSGSADVTFTATFEKLSENSAVLTPANLNDLQNKFFYIQSAGDGQHGPNKGDTRNYILYANNNDTRLKYGLSAPNNDYALWFIEDGKLKNKGSKMFMTDSYDQNETGEAFSFASVGNNGQYQIRTGSHSYTCAWADMEANRNSSLGENSMTSWYFIYDSDITLSWIGNSYITIGGKDNENVVWYKGSNTAGTMANFDGANLGSKTSSIILGGQVQAYQPTDNGIEMWYKVVTSDDSEAIVPTSFDLPKELDPQTGENQTNNSRHYAETTIDISGLTDNETYTLHVWFSGEDGVVVWDSNDSQNYKANFQKSSTTGVEEVALSHGVSVNNGIITVKGVEDFEVYSLAGQQVNAKQALQAGIYIVKVKDTAVKVVVK